MEKVVFLTKDLIMENRNVCTELAQPHSSWNQSQKVQRTTGSQGSDH